MIAVMLLLQKEGAKQATWILPLIALAYLIDNRLSGQASFISPDAFFIPK